MIIWKSHRVEEEIDHVISSYLPSGNDGFVIYNDASK